MFLTRGMTGRNIMCLRQNKPCENKQLYVVY